MRRLGCECNGWLPRWYWLLVWASVLAMAYGAGPVSAQSTTTLPPIEPPPGYVLIRIERWERLTTLSIALEMRLTGRVEQVTMLQTQLGESTKHSAELRTALDDSETRNVELQDSQMRLQTEVGEISTSLESSERLLTEERAARTVERAEYVRQIVTARSQRDAEAARADDAERRANRNGLTWKIGIPLALVVGAVVGAQL